VSDRIGRPVVLVLLFVVALAALLLMIAAESFAPLVLGMAAIASCYGGFVAVMGPVTADTFGARHLGVNFGVMFLSIAVAAVAGPQLGAVVAEAGGGDYTAAFVVAAIISACGLAIAAGYFVAMRRARAREAGHVRSPAAD
jgi:OFA family oxalate/formate antiporter-like MFS transporter